jgi:hypothetical protein
VLVRHAKKQLVSNILDKKKGDDRVVIAPARLLLSFRVSNILDKKKGDDRVVIALNVTS